MRDPDPTVGEAQTVVVVHVYGWPELTEEQVVRLYVEEDPAKQVEIGNELGLCDEARRWICEDHSETDAHLGYYSKRKRLQREALRATVNGHDPMCGAAHVPGFACICSATRRP